MLDALSFVEDGQLTAAGKAFEDAAWVCDDEATAARLFVYSLLGLPATQALLQGLHGRGPVSFAATHHFMARHGLAERSDQTKLRSFLVVLNAAGVVAYSSKLQTVRALAPVPEEQAASLRVVEPERPYPNVLVLHETLRACDARRLAQPAEAGLQLTLMEGRSVKPSTSDARGWAGIRGCVG